MQLAEVWGMIRKMNGIKRNYEIPIMHNNNVTAISSSQKAELLAKTLVKVHSSDNLSRNAMLCRDKTLEQNTGITGRMASSGDALYVIRAEESNPKCTSNISGEK